MVKCVKTGKIYDTVNDFAADVVNTGSYGYEVIAPAKRVKSNITPAKNAIDPVPKPAEAHETELKAAENADAIAKTLDGEKPKSRRGRKPKKDK